MILLLCGNDRFARIEALNELRRERDADGSLNNNTIRFEAARLRLDELRRAAGAAPFLGDWRLVRVDGLCERYERGGRRGLGEWSGLGEALAEIPVSTLLVFVDDAVRRDNPIRRQIETVGSVREFAPLKERDALDWLRQQLRTDDYQDLHLTRGAANALVERTGGDRGAMTGAVQKLALYAGGAGVDEQVVELLVPRLRSVSIFNLVDAVAERRLADAMRSLDGLRTEGETPLRIIAMITRQFRLMLLAAEVLTDGGGEKEIAAATKQPPWIARRIRNQVRACGPEQPLHALNRILEAEAAIIGYRSDREGGLPDDLAIELLVADLAGAA